MRRLAGPVAGIAVFAVAGCGDLTSYGSLTNPANDPTMKLIWAAEFNGPGNAPPDYNDGSSTALPVPGWGFDVGTGPNKDGWGNGELEYYTNRPDNVRQDGQGNLVLYALQEEYQGRHYTSARLTTKGLFSEVYGHIEARIKLPRGAGMWPAFWMLGDNIDEVRWPNCGEIDIMENTGGEPAIAHGSLHGPGYSAGGALTAPAGLIDGTHFADAFHVFAIDWNRSGVRFTVDGKPYASQQPSVVTGVGKTWAFDHRFYLLLNLAVGGNFTNGLCPVGQPDCVPDGTTVFPQQMEIDYIRWYQAK